MFSRKAMELSARSRRSHIWARVLGPSTRMAARRRMRRRLYPVAGRDCIRLPNMFSGGLATPVSMAQRAGPAVLVDGFGAETGAGHNGRKKPSGRDAAQLSFFEARIHELLLGEGGGEIGRA